MTSCLPDGAIPLALAGVVDDSGSVVLHAGTTAGLSIRDDDGWQPVDVPGADVTTVSALTVLCSGDGTPVLLGGVNGGVIRLDSQESGCTTVSLGAPPPLVTCIAGSGQRLLAGSLEDGMFQSDDGGATWRSANVGLLDMAIYGIASVQAPDGRDVALAATETTVFVSGNGGRTWRGTGLDAGDAPVQAIAAVPASDLIVAGTGGSGLYRTTIDAGEWLATGENLPSPHIVALHAIDNDPGGPTIVAVLDAGVAVSTDGATTWRYSDLGSDSEARIVSSCLLSGARSGTSLAIGLDNGCIRVIPDILAAT